MPQLARVIRPSPHGHRYMGLNHGLHFSGGEPFLNFELLLKAVEIAKALKIPSTFVETNCFWCKNDRITRERLRLLKAKGLIGIMISVNPYYLEYIPFERTDRCIRISLEVFGSNVAVYQMEYYRLFKQLRLTGKRALDDDIAQNGGRSLAAHVELLLMGRAVQKLNGVYPSYAAQRFLDVPCQPEFLRHWHNHFDNYGNYMPGFCGGISLGSWFELDRLITQELDLDQRPILKFLIRNDMKGLLHFAVDRGYQARETGYVSKCHLCLDIRKHLVSRKAYGELQPIEFYAHLN